MWKENGITVIPVVASVALAWRNGKEGADAVIAEEEKPEVMSENSHHGLITPGY
jgi:hypothetical protein